MFLAYTVYSVWQQFYIPKPITTQSKLPHFFCFAIFGFAGNGGVRFIPRERFAPPYPMSIIIYQTYTKITHPILSAALSFLLPLSDKLDSF